MNAASLTPTQIARFRARLARESSGCIVWTGFIMWAGYGHFTIHGRCFRAHRVAYELARGPIPDGLVLDHLCRNRACCNPEHLEAVTVRENNLRSAVGLAAINAAKTHCPQGHPYDGDNLKINAAGHRVCRICRNAKSRRRNERLRATRSTA